MKKIITKIVILIIALNFSIFSAQNLNAQNPKETTKKEVKVKEEKNTSAASTSTKTKTQSKHKFFIHYINIASGNSQYA